MTLRVHPCLAGSRDIRRACRGPQREPPAACTSRARTRGTAPASSRSLVRSHGYQHFGFDSSLSLGPPALASGYNGVMAVCVRALVDLRGGVKTLHHRVSTHRPPRPLQPSAPYSPARPPPPIGARFSSSSSHRPAFTLDPIVVPSLSSWIPLRPPEIKAHRNF